MNTTKFTKYVENEENWTQIYSGTKENEKRNRNRFKALYDTMSNIIHSPPHPNQAIEIDNNTFLSSQIDYDVLKTFFEKEYNGKKIKFKKY